MQKIWDFFNIFSKTGTIKRLIAQAGSVEGESGSLDEMADTLAF